MRRLPLAICFISALPAWAQISDIAGSYTGQYQCGGQWITMTLQVSGENSGSISGGVVVNAPMPIRVRRPTKPFAMRGSYDRGTQLFSLSTGRESIYLGLNLKAPLALRGTFDPQKRFLVGTIEQASCGNFILVPSGSNQYAVELLKGQITRQATLRKRDADRAASGFVPPELRENGGAVTCGDDDPCQYFDAKSTGLWKGDIEPIDEVSQWLRDSGYKCLYTKELSLRGGQQGSVVGVTFGRKQFVIECKANCQELRYSTTGVGAQFYSYGKSKPLPVLAVQTGLFYNTTFQWHFSITGNSATETQIRVHAWSNTPGDQGPGCNLF